MLNRSRWITLSLGLSLLSACLQTQAPLNPTLNQPMNQVVKAAQTVAATKPIIFDLGAKGSTASFQFTIKPAAGEQGFKTKDSESGHQHMLDSNVDTYRVYLMDLGSVPTWDQVFDGTDTGIFKLPTTGHYVDIAASALPQPVVFKNVPTSGASGSNHYFVAVQAFDSVEGNITNDTPLADPGAPNNNRILIDPDNTGPNPPEYAYRSNGGGDNSPGTFPGGVQVTSAHDIPTGQEDLLTLGLKLWDEAGATLDSQVNVTSGSSGYQGSIVVN